MVDAGKDAQSRRLNSCGKPFERCRKGQTALSFDKHRRIASLGHGKYPFAVGSRQQGSTLPAIHPAATARSALIDLRYTLVPYSTWQQANFGEAPCR